ncbi:MAG: four helix bundle suffix domain-containing protein [Candidatus Berkelbacteria bacterium]|nr:four helix bundle suffix domain-containing protein [Candidatus Berkelbacteria bacterium]
MNKVKYLLTYRYAEIIQDLTVEFSRIYTLSSLSNLSDLNSGQRRPDYRTADQMNQAARSGKQNIVEAVGQSQTSEKGQIKLLGVAKASFEELLSDYEDFLRQNKFKIFPLDSPFVSNFRKIAYKLSNLSNLSDLGEFKLKPKLTNKPESDANFLLTLCHQETFLLNKQINATEEKFVKEGGFNEKLYNKRRNFRGF